MKPRWAVVAVGDGWNYRVIVQTTVTRWGARRVARLMSEAPGAIPMRFGVERL